MDKKEVAQGVVNAGGSLLTRIGRLMPKGGVHMPAIRNRSLYIGNGNTPTPITGRIYTGKALLTGHRPAPRKVARRRRR